MTALALVRPGPPLPVPGLVAGVAIVVAVRAAMPTGSVAGALAAGAIFGLAMLLVAAAAGSRPGPASRAALVGGVVGGAVLVGFTLLLAPPTGFPLLRAAAPFAPWAGVTLLVAVAEEAVFRGALFDALERRRGTVLAVVATSVGFALLHVPLYGWHVAPLDVGVGLWFAGLRLASGGFAAPAMAHAIADLATWWM